MTIADEEAELLGVEEGAPGLRFHTLARDREGTPAYYATSLFRGDRYEIELRQTRAELGAAMSSARMKADMAAQPGRAAPARPKAREIADALAGTEPAGVVVVARGSSDYAAIFARYLLEAATRPAGGARGAEPGHALRAAPRLEGWLAIGLSQSGRTPEITTVLERYGAAGARTVAVTNDPRARWRRRRHRGRARRRRGGRGAGHQDLHRPAGRGGR